MNFLLIINFVLNFCLLLLVGFLVFFKSYFSEKGKNVATKEDVAEITSKVEQVRAQAAIFTEARVSHRAEEAKALIDYFSKYAAWFSGLSDFNPTISSEAEYESFADRQGLLASLARECELSAGKVEIFVGNEEIPVTHHRLYIATLDVQKFCIAESYEFVKRHLELMARIAADPDKKVDLQIEYFREQPEHFQGYAARLQERLAGLLPLRNQQRGLIATQLRAAFET